MPRPTLEQLADRAEINDVLLRYFRGLDRWDLDLVRGCFAPDARLNYTGEYDGGVDGFMAWLARDDNLGRATRTMHRASNILVELDGDVAHTECYAAAHHTTASDHPWGDAFATMWLRYLDRFVRREDTWAIAYREIVVEWVRLDTAGMFETFESTARRDRTDPSYRR